MHYINPYELLGINAANLSELDSKTVMKEKKKLLYEIELSDKDSIKHNGIELTKSDCLKAIDDLDNRNKREFHFFIFQNKPLNDFLSKGSIIFFEQYQIESIYKLSEFLDFISPYFASQYDKILSENFRKQNITAVSKIISLKPITNEVFFESCYKSTYSIIRNLDCEINGIIKEVELKQSAFLKNNFYGLDSVIAEKVNVDLINLLPAYFQSLRNQLAQSIRNLARDINNEPYYLYEPAYKIIKIANSFSTDGLVKQTITKGYYTIKKNYEDGLQKQEEVIQTAITTNPTPVIDTKPDVKEKAEPKSGSTNNYYTGFLIILSSFLIWALFNDTVQRIILSIAALMYILSLANIVKRKKDYSKNANTQSLIYILLLITCVGGFFYPFLSILFISYCLVLLAHSLYFSLLFKKNPKQEEVFGYAIIALVVALLFWNYQNNQKSDSTPVTAQKELSAATNNDNSVNNYSSSSTPTDTSTSFSTNPASTNNYPETEPIYIKVFMKDGNISECSGFTPKYNYKLNNRLVITANLSDAAVKIFDYETDKCIRYVFIKNGTTYTVKNIPEGKYYLKIAYGDDWTVKEGDPICKGRFTSNALYKRGDKVLDYNLKYTDEGYEVPSYSLTLTTTFTYDKSDSYSNPNQISENDFYNN